ncbi:hypothetical protein KSP39_PZI022721 [Platanthera zijinensis]|uniref:FMR1-interacting protein 1 conserved domain-containing protein n=1 Tax=Platanthera zijinensis TaxID=2320716 RepID=A0AAP0FV71_9ASPA
MLPFQPPFPNQNQVRGATDPSLNQPPSSSNPRPNQFGFNPPPPTMMPPMGGFHNSNALLGSLLAQQQLIQGLQNNIIAALSQQGVMPQFHGQQQLNMLAGLQNPNLTPLPRGGLLGRPPLNHNPNQMTGFLPNRLLCSQNPNFVPNSQLPVMSAGIPSPAFLSNGNPQVRPSISKSLGLETQIASQNLQRPILPCSMLTNPSSVRQWPQMNPNQAGGNNFSSNSSENVANNNFKTIFNGPGKREPSNLSSGNAWKKARQFPIIDGRGPQQRNEKNTKFSQINSSSTMIRKRPLAVIYSESEVRQWRDSRKRNFPTRTNIEKKLTPSSEKKEDMDSDAKALRQQLKEILAKQAELGVPVAEIPPNYLREPKVQTLGNINTHRASNTHVNTQYNKFNNSKRPALRSYNWNAKRLKFKNEEPSSYTPVVRKREPTLLRKLLNADIRRDKSQLLQAFRFMVLNSFFKNSPNEPLVFPIITAKDAVAPETGVVGAKELLQNDVEFAATSTGRDRDDEEIESDSDEMDGATDVVCEAIGEDFTIAIEKPEEGELTN